MVTAHWRCLPKATLMTNTYCDFQHSSIKIWIMLQCVLCKLSGLVVCKRADVVRTKLAESAGLGLAVLGLLMRCGLIHVPLVL